MQDGSTRFAATVMLVRPGARALEVFMLRRSEASHFAPDVYVFPGGTVDASDRSPELRARALGLEAYDSERVPTAPDDAAAMRLAAIRELFEEAGVLMAVDAAGRAASAVHGRGALHHARETLASGSATFAEVLRTLDLYAACQELVLFSHWITPPAYPKRYDTHFFAASAQAEEIASADALETHDGVWVEPQRALDGARDGTFKMVYPTIKHVERLTAFDTPEALVRFARVKPIRTIVPETADRRTFDIPPELEAAW